MAAARAGAQRRARPRHHRATAAEEQVPHLGTGTAGGGGASRRPRLRRSRRSASTCAPRRGGARAVPLRGGRRGPASLPCVCLSNRLGLAAPAPPVGDEVLRAGMLVDWPGRPGPRDPVELHPTRCSFKASLRPAPLPLRRLIDGPERVIPVVPDLQAPVLKLSLLRARLFWGFFFPGCTITAVPTPSGTGNEGQREPTVVSGEAPRLPARFRQLQCSSLLWCLEGQRA